MADEYESFVRGLQKVGAKPFVREYVKQNADVIRTLNEQVKRGNLTLALGAGVSVPSGVPDWKKVIEALTRVALSERGDRGVAYGLKGLDLPSHRATRILESVSAGFRFDRA